MPDSLKAIEEKLERLEAQMNAPETYADPALFARLARERKALLPAVEASRRVQRLEADITAAQELDFAPEELAALLDEKYSMYADRRGWQVELAEVNRTELGGIKEAVFTVEGEGAWRSLKYESGVHQVKRVPATESSGRIQTSTATVAVLPEVDEVDFTLDPKDLRIDVFRASGAGGQKVNKTSSAIRVTHLPTGLVVECQDERSQLQNKERAMRILRSRLYEAEAQKQTDAVAAQRRSQVGTGERSEKIRTYFFLRGQVVDQRLSGDERCFRLESVLNGDLDEIIDRLIRAEQAEKLKAGNE